MGTTLQVWKRRRGKWAALKKQWAAVKERKREREWETECVSCYFDGSEVESAFNPDTAVDEVRTEPSAHSSGLETGIQQWIWKQESDK